MARTVVFWVLRPTSWRDEISVTYLIRVVARQEHQMLLPAKFCLSQLRYTFGAAYAKLQGGMNENCLLQTGCKFWSTADHRHVNQTILSKT